tara:strand:+ start:1768 stop:1953 length:186 start_codon:yes stop_codon:yes gene_type:complete
MKLLAIKLVFAVVMFQLMIVAATLTGCFVKAATCDEKEHDKILQLMMQISAQSFALYAAEK